MFKNAIIFIIIALLPVSVLSQEYLNIMIIDEKLPQRHIINSSWEKTIPLQKAAFKIGKRFDVFQAVRLKGKTLNYWGSVYMNTIMLNNFYETRMDIYKNTEEDILYRYSAADKTWAWTIIFDHGKISYSVLDNDGDGYPETAEIKDISPPHWVREYAEEASRNFNHLIPSESEEVKQISLVYTAFNEIQIKYQKKQFRLDTHRRIPAKAKLGNLDFVYFGSAYDALDNINVRIDLYSTIEGKWGQGALGFQIEKVDNIAYCYTLFLKPDVDITKYPELNFSLIDTTGDGYWDKRGLINEKKQIPDWLKPQDKNTNNKQKN